MINMNHNVLRKITYGLYIITSHRKHKLNGQIANTVFQVSSKPTLIAICINKENYTNEFISRSNVFSVSILRKEAPLKLIGQFGFKCGRDCDKFENVEYKIGVTGSPIILDNTIGYIEAKVIGSMDVSTHILYIGTVVEGDLLSDGEPMTYAYYHEIKGGVSPKTAPTYIENELKENVKKMEKYVCKICGYVYDPMKGDSNRNIEVGTPFEDLPNEWVCPICGAPKNKFVKV